MDRHHLSNKLWNALDNVCISVSTLSCITARCLLLVFSGLDPTTRQAGAILEHYKMPKLFVQGYSAITRTSPIQR